MWLLCITRYEIYIPILTIVAVIKNTLCSIESRNSVCGSIIIFTSGNYFVNQQAENVDFYDPAWKKITTPILINFLFFANYDDFDIILISVIIYYVFF